MINKGDEVGVVMSRNNIFEFQVSPIFYAKVLYTPNATGDLWVLETLDGIEISINPNASDFIGFELHKTSPPSVG